MYALSPILNRRNFNTDLFQNFDRELDELLKVGVNRSTKKGYELVEKDNSFLLSIDMPGVKKENLEITEEKGQLRIVGKRSSLTDEAEFSDTYEYFYNLAESVDHDNIEASLNDGILSVVIPKKVEEKVLRSIEVK